jgi:type II secretory pathway component PulJ
VRIQRRRLGSATGGFSYVEILVSVVLLAVLLVPAVEALHTAIRGRPTAAAIPGSLALQSKMEQVLAAPFARIYEETYKAGGNTPTSVSALFSDAAGTPDRRIVVIYRYDASAKALSTADTGLAYVSVYYEAQGASGALATLTGRWW